MCDVVASRLCGMLCLATEMSSEVYSADFHGHSPAVTRRYPIMSFPTGGYNSMPHKTLGVSLLGEALSSAPALISTMKTRLPS